MTIHKLPCLIFMFCAWQSVFAAHQPQKAVAPVQVQNLMAHKDWSFTENKGQLKDETGQPLPEIKFYGHSKGVYLYCKPGMISFVFTKVEIEQKI